MKDVRQFDAVELEDGRRVVVLDIYENPPGYEVEDVAATSSEGYDGDPSFSIAADKVKRVLEREKPIKELDVIELSDGREVTVLDVHPDGSCMCEDNDLTDGCIEEDDDDQKDYLIDVSPDQIKRVAWTAP
jgi:hypothetical protein